MFEFDLSVIYVRHAMSKCQKISFEFQSCLFYVFRHMTRVQRDALIMLISFVTYVQALFLSVICNSSRYTTRVH